MLRSFVGIWWSGYSVSCPPFPVRMSGGCSGDMSGTRWEYTPSTLAL